MTNDIADELNEWLIPNALLSVSVFIVYIRFSSLVTSTMSHPPTLICTIFVTVLVPVIQTS